MNEFTVEVASRSNMAAPSPKMATHSLKPSGPGDGYCIDKKDVSLIFAVTAFGNTFKMPDTSRKKKHKTDVQSGVMVLHWYYKGKGTVVYKNSLFF